jgi:hypothetical protein
MGNSRYHKKKGNKGKRDGVWMVYINIDVLQ